MFLAAHHGLARGEVPERARAPRPPATQIIFLRRTNGRGHIQLLGVELAVAAHWPHRLVRAELDVTTQTLRVYALRRRDPSHQPLLKTMRYTLLGDVIF